MIRNSSRIVKSVVSLISSFIGMVALFIGMCSWFLRDVLFLLLIHPLYWIVLIISFMYISIFR